MFILYADKNKLTLRKRERITSGSVNVEQVRFEFSPEWDGLSKTAVFRIGEESHSVLLDQNGECTIPWEMMTTPGKQLMCGVYGTMGTEIVLPTVWENLGVILEGVNRTGEVVPPTPELWEQALAGKADGLDLDGQILSLLSGDKKLDSVSLPSGGGEGGGVSDHRLLSGRDAENQHPIDSIEGLAAKLLEIPEPVEALTNSELEALLV